MATQKLYRTYGPHSMGDAQEAMTKYLSGTMGTMEDYTVAQYKWFNYEDDIMVYDTVFHPVGDRL